MAFLSSLANPKQTLNKRQGRHPVRRLPFSMGIVILLPVVLQLRHQTQESVFSFSIVGVGALDALLPSFCILRTQSKIERDEAPR